MNSPSKESKQGYINDIYRLKFKIWKLAKKQFREICWVGVFRLRLSVLITLSFTEKSLKSNGLNILFCVFGFYFLQSFCMWVRFGFYFFSEGTRS